MKKIHIQSESNDLSTDDVLAWIKYLDKNAEVVKYFDDIILQDICLELNNEQKIININGNKIDNLDSFWYRRGQFKRMPILEQKNKEFYNKIDIESIAPAIDYLSTYLVNLQINKFEDNFSNKLKMLEVASNCGLLIPNTLVTNDLTKLTEFVKSNVAVITKPIKNPFINFNLNNYLLKFNTHSKLITYDDVFNSNRKFSLSFFQQYIDKKVEIRSFYLNGIFRSMAIFSQQNEKTKIDFRNYDRIRPNRCVPYQLPKSLERKLVKFMNKMDIVSGSFDIILTPKNEYVFLEVNPIGQFQWLSVNCNYFIERDIANQLLNYEN